MLPTLWNQIVDKTKNKTKTKTKKEKKKEKKNHSKWAQVSLSKFIIHDIQS